MEVRYYTIHGKRDSVEIPEEETIKIVGSNIGRGYSLLGIDQPIDNIARLKSEDEKTLISKGVLSEKLPRAIKYDGLKGVDSSDYEEFVDKYPDATVAEGHAWFEGTYEPPRDARRR